ncbi:MAG: hypothetical protein NTW86_14900 [Candidatus Sumerlaeota bacterium]|nr:hypothetical protein [Candidatus Sumerlaeota bacterium]
MRKSEDSAVESMEPDYLLHSARVKTVSSALYQFDARGQRRRRPIEH